MVSIATYVVVGGLLLVMAYAVVRALVRSAPEDRAVEIDVKSFPPRIRYKLSARDPLFRRPAQTPSESPDSHDETKPEIES